MKRVSLKQYKKRLNSLPDSLIIKREMREVINELTKTIKDSKKFHANSDYFRPKIDHMFRVIRKVL